MYNEKTKMEINTVNTGADFKRYRQNAENKK
jgi:hypothetical protein